jgi:hypothetical protein
LSEIISALSVALEIPQGRPRGHCMHSAPVAIAGVVEDETLHRSRRYVVRR